MLILSLALFVPTALMLLLVISNVRSLPRITPNVAPRPHALSILIPARNEAARLPRCLESVTAQNETVLEVLVYDDHSCDGTASVVREYAQRDNRVRLLEPTALPEGWCGKPFACAYLARHAQGRWFLFLDADAQLRPGASEGLLAAAERHDVTFLSAWPDLVLATFWEKALMPMLSFAVFSLFPVKISLEYPYPSLGLAHGACILVRRDEYREIGGHEAVHDQVVEDVSLAQAWRAHGHRGLLLDGQDIVSVRMYQTFGEIWRGFQKSAYPAFRGASSCWLFMAFHLWCFVGPFVLLPVSVGARIAALFSLLSVLNVLAMRVLLARRFGHSPWAALLHPVAELMFVAVGISSWWRCATGRGVSWKGRTYDPGPV